MGKITILDETTKNPITLMGKRAGTCWNSDIFDEQKNYKRGLDCISSGHGRVMEYVNVEMVLDGYSARVIREWYTHIGGAPTRLQESTRYIGAYTFGYVIPPSIKRDAAAQEIYRQAIMCVRNAMEILRQMDAPKEDIAMLLPLGMKTKIVDKRNLRNLVEMSRQRMCNRAYWEFRELFNDILEELKEYSDEWKILIDDLKVFKPKCADFGYCTEKNGCGKFPKKGVVRQ